jgi:hypothetical protein
MIVPLAYSGRAPRAGEVGFPALSSFDNIGT